MDTLIHTLRPVLPWLAALCFGAVVFAVGKYLQGQERKKQAECRNDPFGKIPEPAPFNIQNPTPSIRDLGTYRGKGAQQQEKVVH